jgi:hypothetical protein
MWRTPISLLIVLCFGAIAEAQVPRGLEGIATDADRPVMPKLSPEEVAANEVCIKAVALWADGQRTKEVEDWIQQCTTKASRGICELAIKWADEIKEHIKFELPSNFVCRGP